jgi:pimeloyl-ACP methyl ester carboxylesterase
MCVNRLKFIVRLTLLIGIACASLLPRPAAAQTAPRFESADCAVMSKPESKNILIQALLGAIPPDSGMECGYVIVPEEHGKDNGKTIKLAVVVMRANGEGVGPRPDPIFFLQGGPGGGTIDTFMPLLRNVPIDDGALRATRDIVLFDQRGTGKSLPALKCPEIYALTLETIEQRIGREDVVKRGEAAMDACRKRLIAEGINLNAFDSVENAADIEAIRQALSYERINLYGVSYGTLLALHTLRDHPEFLRSVVLDAVVPTQTNFIVEVPRNQQRAFSELFAACAADARCKQDYPDLEKMFYAAVEKFDKSPARVRMSDPETGRSYSAVVNGDTLMGWLFQSMYSSELLPYLPHVINDLNAGRTESLGTILGAFAFQQAVASGMYYSVVCAEDSDFEVSDVLNTAGLNPRLAESVPNEVASIKRTCTRFNVEQLPKSVDDPVRSEIPVLVLNGRFDPITPPVNGEEAAKTLPNSRVYTFPNTGHGAFTSRDCAKTIMSSFLDAPSDQPDDACIGDEKPVSFARPNDLIRVPVMGELLTATPYDRLGQMSAYTIALLVLLTGLLLLPLGWLARLILNKNHATLKPPFIANAMPWLVLFTAALAAVFLGGLVGLPFAAAGEGSASYFIGIGSDNRALFVIPVLIVLFTVLIIWGVIAGWRSGAWGLGRKLYRSVLALAAMAIAVVLVLWNVVGTPLLG